LTSIINPSKKKFILRRVKNLIAGYFGFWITFTNQITDQTDQKKTKTFSFTNQQKAIKFDLRVAKVSFS